VLIVAVGVGLMWRRRTRLRKHQGPAVVLRKYEDAIAESSSGHVSACDEKSCVDVGEIAPSLIGTCGRSSLGAAIQPITWDGKGVSAGLSGRRSSKAGAERGDSPRRSRRLSGAGISSRRSSKAGAAELAELSAGHPIDMSSPEQIGGHRTSSRDNAAEVALGDALGEALGGVSIDISGSDRTAEPSGRQSADDPAIDSQRRQSYSARV